MFFSLIRTILKANIKIPEIDLSQLLAPVQENQEVACWEIKPLASCASANKEDEVMQYPDFLNPSANFVDMAGMNTLPPTATAQILSDDLSTLLTIIKHEQNYDYFTQDPTGIDNNNYDIYRPTVQFGDFLPVLTVEGPGSYTNNPPGDTDNPVVPFHEVVKEKLVEIYSNENHQIIASPDVPMSEENSYTHSVDLAYLANNSSLASFDLSDIYQTFENSHPEMKVKIVVSNVAENMDFSAFWGGAWSQNFDWKYSKGSSSYTLELTHNIVSDSLYSDELYLRLANSNAATQDEYSQLLNNFQLGFSSINTGENPELDSYAQMLHETIAKLEQSKNQYQSAMQISSNAYTVANNNLNNWYSLKTIDSKKTNSYTLNKYEDKWKKDGGTPDKIPPKVEEAYEELSTLKAQRDLELHKYLDDYVRYSNYNKYLLELHDLEASFNAKNYSDFEFALKNYADKNNHDLQDSNLQQVILEQVIANPAVLLTSAIYNSSDNYDVSVKLYDTKNKVLESLNLTEVLVDSKAHGASEYYTPGEFADNIYLDTSFMKGENESKLSIKFNVDLADALDTNTISIELTDAPWVLDSAASNAGWLLTDNVLTKEFSNTTEINYNNEPVVLKLNGIAADALSSIDTNLTLLSEKPVKVGDFDLDNNMQLTSLHDSIAVLKDGASETVKLGDVISDAYKFANFDASHDRLDLQDLFDRYFPEDDIDSRLSKLELNLSGNDTHLDLVGNGYTHTLVTFSGSDLTGSNVEDFVDII